MTKLAAFFNSAIGKKLIMSLTGLFLCAFIIVHLSGNLQLFKHDGGYAFNIYAVFMTTNPLIKTISYGLYAMILVHAIRGLVLVLENKRARPVGYAVKPGNANASWASRNMGLLGTILLVFIVVHMSKFWFVYKFGYVPYVKYEINEITGDISSSPAEAVHDKKAEFPLMDASGNTIGKTVIVKDLQKEVEVAFKELWIVLFYVISMFALAFHLIHGFRSAFQTLGINHPRYNPLINFIGVLIFGILIPLGFASMPLYFFFQ